MARRIDSRLILTGQLIAETPISVGGMGGDTDVDLALAVDGRGRLYIPGTSLAGPLRAWLCARVKDKAKVEDLWGFQRKKKGTDEDEGQASFVIVENGLVYSSDGKRMQGSDSEVRDGVGIDRRTGAAANKAKYNRAILPRGSRIDLRMTVELDDCAGDTNSRQAVQNQRAREQAKGLIAALWKALQDGEIRFGASKTRGLGRVKMEPKSQCEQKLITRAGLLDTLRGKPTPPGWKIAQENQPVFCKQPGLTFEIDWEPVGPLMVKAEADGLAVDMLPLVGRVDDKLTLVLPGSSIKGALRSHAERIVRTVRPELQPELPEKFLNQVKVPLIEELFGAAGEARKKNSRQDQEPCPENLEPIAGLSALSIDDCYAKSESRMTALQWAGVEGATNEEALRAALDRTPLKDAQQAFHVAIDRWLGSAAEGFLYTVLEPHGVQWEPIRMKLDLARLPNYKRNAAVACALLVLRDFVSGRLPLGFGVNRGMGAVEVKGITLKPHDLEDDDLARLKLSVDKDKRQLKIGDDELRQTLNEAWQSDEWFIKKSGQSEAEPGEIAKENE